MSFVTCDPNLADDEPANRAVTETLPDIGFVGIGAIVLWLWWKSGSRATRKRRAEELRKDKAWERHRAWWKDHTKPLELA